MLANANPQLNEAPADRNVREVIAICAKDGVPYGELNSLVGFMRALNENKQFAMHFWSLVSRLSQQSHDAENPEWLLAALVEGVTAKPLAEVREAGPAHRVLVTRLAKMLAGEDVQEPVQDVSATPASGPKVVSRRSTVSQALAAEPEAPVRTPRTRDTAAPDPITNPAWTKDESLRLVLRHDPVITEVPETRSNRIRLDHGPEIAIPLSSYAGDEPRSSSRNLVLGIAALVILGLAGFGVYSAGGAGVFGRLGSSLHAGYDSAVSTWRGEPAQSPAPAPVASAPAPAPAPVAAATSADQPAQTPPAAKPANPPAQSAGSTPQTAQTPGQTANPVQPQPPSSGHRYYYPRRAESYPRTAESESMAEIAADHQRRAEPPAKVIPIPDITTATPAPHATGTSHPEDQPSPTARPVPSGGATGVSTPPSMEQP